MRSKFVLSLMVLFFVATNGSSKALGAFRGRNVTLICHIKTIEHINCGGGLRPPNETPPDCTNFVSEHVVEEKDKKMTIPSRYLYYLGNQIRLSRSVAFLSSEGRKIVYYMGPNLYTDAAGWSVDSGFCSILSGNGAIRRKEAPKK